MEFKVHLSSSWLPLFSLWTVHHPYKLAEPLGFLLISTVYQMIIVRNETLFNLKWFLTWTQANISYFYLFVYKRNCHRLWNTSLLKTECCHIFNFFLKVPKFQEKHVSYLFKCLHPTLNGSQNWVISELHYLISK